MVRRSFFWGSGGVGLGSASLALAQNDLPSLGMWEKLILESRRVRWLYADSLRSSVIAAWALAAGRCNGTNTTPWVWSWTMVQTSEHWSQSQ
jgi:hypothetical protein